jgi:hypothetical protein
LEKVKKISLIFLVLLMVDWGSIHAQSLANAGLLTGMNINTTVDRKALVEQLKEAHVEIVRCSLNNASLTRVDAVGSACPNQGSHPGERDRAGRYRYRDVGSR